MPEIPFPKVLRIEPASQCNLACTHCPTGTVAMDRGIMSMAIFNRILDSVRPHRNEIKVLVLYHGGEPLLNKRFFEMVSKLREECPSVHVKTVSNGMILTEKITEALIRCGIDAIEFSLDGTSDEESKRIRVKSEPGIVINNIKRLIAKKRSLDVKKPDITISTTQFIDQDSTFPLVDSPLPLWLQKAFPEDVTFKSTYAMRWPHMSLKGGEYELREDPHGADGNECDHVLNTMTVRADGTVVPCCYDLTTRMPMGNVIETTLAKIWNGEEYQSLRRSITGRDYKSICNSCGVVRPQIFLMPKWRQYT